MRGSPCEDEDAVVKEHHGRSMAACRETADEREIVLLGLAVALCLSAFLWAAIIAGAMLIF